jgi:hypothetical protein
VRDVDVEQETCAFCMSDHINCGRQIEAQSSSEVVQWLSNAVRRGTAGCFLPASDSGTSRVPDIVDCIYSWDGYKISDNECK